MGAILASRKAFVAAVIAVGMLTSGCVLTFTGGGGSGPCYEGTWELSGSQIADAVGSLFGDLTITPDDDGMTLELNSDGTFSFSGSQTLGVSGSTPWGTVNGTVDATVDVGGNYASNSPSTLSFTLGSLSGTGSFNGTLGGTPYSATLSLDQFGLDELYGLTGTADYTCGGGSLGLDLPSVHWSF